MSASFDIANEYEERKKLNEDELVARMDKWAATGQYSKDMNAIKFCGAKVVSEAVGKLYPVNERSDVRIVDVGAGTGDLGEKDMNAIKFCGAKVVSEAVGKLYPVNERSDVRIVDVGAGTGDLGEKLLNLGFKNIDGIDPSKEMMKIAKQRKIYQNHYIEYMDGKKIADIDTDYFDCAALSGVISDGLAPTNAFFELVRIVKPGGLIVFSTHVGFEESNEEYRNRVRPLFDKFENEKVWKMEKKDKIPQYNTTADGWLFVFQVLVSETSISKLPKLNRKE